MNRQLIALMALDHTVVEKNHTILSANQPSISSHIIFTLGNTLPQGIVVTFEVGLNSVFGPL